MVCFPQKLLTHVSEWEHRRWSFSVQWNIKMLNSKQGVLSLNKHYNGEHLVGWEQTERSHERSHMDYYNYTLIGLLNRRKIKSSGILGSWGKKTSVSGRWNTVLM